MLNELTAENSRVEDYSLINGILPIHEIFSPEIVVEIEKFKSNKIDNLVIHGLPVPVNLVATPQEIRSAPKDIFPAYIIKSIGNFIGTISDKDLENTVRFRNTESGDVNEETWHGHSQYKCSVFYCLRADPEAKTYFFSVNEIIKNALPEIANSLQASFSYIPEKSPFPLVIKGESGYELSLEIYGRSDFEKYVKDLDLPDVVKALKKISADNLNNSEAQGTVDYLLNAILTTTSYIVYKPGDIALYNETSTMRFSPSYIPSTTPEDDRWILSLSVEK
jgi:hypothetical protein